MVNNTLAPKENTLKAVIRRYFYSAHAQSDEDRSDLNFEREEQLAADTKAVIRRLFSFRACAE